MIQQHPQPGSVELALQGDLWTVELTTPRDWRGAAWLRTNLGRGAERRREIVAAAEHDAPVLAADWHDIPMRTVAPGRHIARVPLAEIGVFAGKAFFAPAAGGPPRWPAGDNARVKVQPPATRAACTLYSLFARQFGPNRAAGPTPDQDRAAAYLDAAGYTVIPRSGGFRDVIRELDFIMGTLGFRIIQLLPIHPVPTTYARMGRFGSPFAGLDFMDVDPALAEFDRHTTPLDQFRELVDAVHARGGWVFIDLPINHTGWASWLQIQHPEWFARNEDRSFQSPGAWGVTWEDLSRLDYAQRGLWRYMAEVFRFWCGQGVDGFRCDAGYMVPGEVWTYIVARVRDAFPETVFLLEGLGGKLETMESLLLDSGLDWAYSELFQNYDQAQIEGYLPGALAISARKGLLVHFAETHDNNRLAAVSPAYARLRTALSALLSRQGGFGIANGVEWLAREKIAVHGATPLNWGAPENIVDWLARLNRLLAGHPAFAAGAEIALLSAAPHNTLVARVRAADADCALLVAANLNLDHGARAEWDAAAAPGMTGRCRDLLGDAERRVEARDGRAHIELAPAEIVALSWADDVSVPPLVLADEGVPANRRQRLRAAALALRAARDGAGDWSDWTPDVEADALAADPAAYCARWLGPDADVVVWRWPEDTRRVVMLAPGDIVLLCADRPFTADWCEDGVARRRAHAFPATAGGWHVAWPVPPLDPAEAGNGRVVELRLAVTQDGGRHHATARLLCLPADDTPVVRRRFTAAEVRSRHAYALLTNGRGGMGQVRGAWGTIESQYDAWLAANPHPRVPVDRRILLTRCRAWLVYRGYSQALDLGTTDTFAADGRHACAWRMSVPCGMGLRVGLDLTLTMPPDANAVVLEVARRPAEPGGAWLADDEPVELILRPDIEDRDFHHKTKAFTGPERDWPAAVAAAPDGFRFAPRGYTLDLRVGPGHRFDAEPQWTYMVGHPLDAGRGLDGASDLFSPGYFTINLIGAARATLRARAGDEPAPADAPAPAFEPLPAREALAGALRAYLARRDDGLTVIAGYPWFLDWGRDTFIVLRGLIAAGLRRETDAILRAFARFERAGTLPNMIRGEDDSNRETSDAPLWFVVVCAEFARGPRGQAWLDGDAGGRPLRRVLRDLVAGYMAGTPNGIAMDPASGLIYSPPHFTWMDTNHPAGTPREGYPIEIQALWHHALAFLATLEPDEPAWGDWATRVRASLGTLCRRADGRGFSDCLHAGRGVPAAAATPDDAVRPNQLLAVTLGAVDDPVAARAAVRACAELLVPGAIRSLADRPVHPPLPVWRDGRLLNDPARPYWGRYEGDEDTRRKPAYHNGTAWIWPFPLWCEAYALTHGPGAARRARRLLLSATRDLECECLGHLAEIADGDAPHTARGCGAQAWSVSEVVRVLARLDRRAERESQP